MSLWDILRRRRNVVRGPRSEGGSVDINDLSDPRVKEFLRSGGLATEAGAVIGDASALRVATAYRCVAIITSAVKTVPIDLKRRESERRRVDASDHPLWPVLRRRPNDWQTPSEFRQFLQLCVLHRGNGYARIVRGARRRIIDLVPLNPDRMQVSQARDMSLSYQYRDQGGGTINYEPSDILHLRGLSQDGFTGTSVISHARETLGISIESERHAAKLFKNGMSLGGTLEHPQRLDPGVVARLEASMEKFRGSENAHKTLILEEGMKYSRIDMSSVDAQFIQNRELTQIEIAMFYGVPPHMLGLTQKTTSWGAGIEQQSIGFVAYTLQDWFTMWQEAIERDCLGLDDDPSLYVRLNPAGLIRGDIKTRYAAYAIGRQWGWLSVNDVREKEDMDPVEGGDEYNVPLNMTTLDAMQTIQQLSALGNGAEALAMLTGDLAVAA